MYFFSRESGVQRFYEASKTLNKNVYGIVTPFVISNFTPFVMFKKIAFIIDSIKLNATKYGKDN